MKQKLREIIENTETKQGRIFDWIVQILIILSIIAFSFETLPNISEQMRNLLLTAEYLFIGAFTIEYLLRIYVAKRSWKYITSFYGIIDFLAVIPFYLGLPIDLRSLRVLRVMRIFRTLKIIRYNKALRRFLHVIQIIKEELVIFLVVIAILFYISATGIYFFEHSVQPEFFGSIFDSLWWAIVTLTTVGLGDVYPVTLGGKIFTFFMLVLSLAVISIPAGLIASSFSEVRKNEREANESTK